MRGHVKQLKELRTIMPAVCRNARRCARVNRTSRQSRAESGGDRGEAAARGVYPRRSPRAATRRESESVRDATRDGHIVIDRPAPTIVARVVGIVLST